MRLHLEGRQPAFRLIDFGTNRRPISASACRNEHTGLWSAIPEMTNSDRHGNAPVGVSVRTGGDDSEQYLRRLMAFAPTIHISTELTIRQE